MKWIKGIILITFLWENEKMWKKWKYSNSKGLCKCKALNIFLNTDYISLNDYNMRLQEYETVWGRERGCVKKKKPFFIKKNVKFNSYHFGMKYFHF